MLSDDRKMNFHSYWPYMNFLLCFFHSQISIFSRLLILQRKRELEVCLHMQTRKKVLFTAGVLLVSALVLTACGGKGKDSGSGAAKEVDTYNYVYSTDPTTFDYTVSSRTTNSTHYANFVDGLTENDEYGNIIPSLAEKWDVSEDGLTYTFHLRSGVKWVDSQGNEKADVTAQDFVTGLQHAADAKSETLYIAANSIVGLADYANGKTTDFSTVGVKATDDSTVVYTLIEPQTYFLSKTLYGVFYPVNADFLKEKGDEFGAASADSILYCGPYTLANFTAQSVIEYAKNESYWDVDNVHLNDVKLTYYDGKDVSALYKGFDSGNYTIARVFPTDASYKDVEAKYGDDIVWSEPGGSTFNMTFNFNRRTYNLTSKKTDKEKQDTQKAILNKEFRQSIQFGLNKVNYLAQSVGEDAAQKGIRNTLVPGTFVSISGKDYGETVQADLRELDPDAFGDVELKDGQDAYYNKDKAAEYFKKAKEALTAEGVSFPIHLDLPMVETSTITINQAKSLKQSVEDSLGKDNVVVDIQLASEDAYNTATYLVENSADSDFDISTASGWGPDYQDPSSYLNIYNSNSGDLLTTLGLDAVTDVNGTDPSAAIKKTIGLPDYDALLEAADAITGDKDARYTAYAKAEAWLLDNVIQIPVQAEGAAPALRKTVPFSGPYGWAGIASDKLKYIKATDTVVTAKEYAAAKEKWNAEREKTAE